MLKRGYSKNMSLGPLMGVGTVDALIPPNALTVVLASLANIDVGQLLIAGILPGIIMAGLYIPYAATAAIGFPRDLQQKITKAKGIRGTKFIHTLTPCPTGWRMPFDLSPDVSRLAVETNFFLFMRLKMV
jgi:TRAP-type mannitol/chloroaromatic compound transport system permease large subunit